MRYWAHSGLAAAVLALIAMSSLKALALDMPGPSAHHEPPGARGCREHPKVRERVDFLNATKPLYAS